MSLRSIFESFRVSIAGKKIAYSQLPDESNRDVREPEITDERLLRTVNNIQRSRFNYLFCIAHLVFFLCSVALLALAYSRSPTDSECTAKLFSYSPALEAVEYHEENYKGIFHQPSPYRGHPTPKLDDRWRKLWDYGGFNVPYEKLYLLNKSTDVDWQRTPDEFGGGAVAMLWGFHQLHCLDLVRQALYRDVYEKEYNFTPVALQGPEYLVRMHVDHCIELLRIHMMCHVDVTPYLVVKDANAPLGLRADFSSHHKCRNFDKVQKWVTDNTAVP